MQKLGFVLAILTVAALATPPASAEPVAPIDWRDLVDEIADPTTRSARSSARELCGHLYYVKMTCAQAPRMPILIPQGLAERSAARLLLG